MHWDRFSIDLDVEAPKVALPCFESTSLFTESPLGTPPAGLGDSDTVRSQLLLDFGHFTLKTDQVREHLLSRRAVWVWDLGAGGIWLSPDAVPQERGKGCHSRNGYRRTSNRLHAPQCTLGPKGSLQACDSLGDVVLHFPGSLDISTGEDLPPLFSSFHGWGMDSQLPALANLPVSGFSPLRWSICYCPCAAV